jgi:isopropylmalate/homocitrate/citramalate synthase
LNLPKRVRVVEVGPRDGLQNERNPVPTAAKIAFVDALSRAGFRDIEVSSFVRADKIPQLADAAEVFAKIERRANVRYWALVPNEKGFEAAQSAGVRHIAVFTAATDGFSKANVGVGVQESLQRLSPVIDRARKAGLPVRGYVSTVFGCPYEGKVDPEAGPRVARALLDMGCEEISLGDTIGVAVPSDVDRVLDKTAALNIAFAQIALHLHDTRGTALANVLAGLERGIANFDSSAGGLGGCPFAPGATGNLATEDLLYFLHGMGIETGIEFDAAAESSSVIEPSLAHPLPSRARAAWASKRKSR